MIKVHKNEKGEKFVIASELYQKLGITTPLRKWFPRMVDYGFDEGNDYFRADKKVRAEKGGTQIAKDWHITLDMAKHIAMVQRTPDGKAIRNYLLNLDKEVQNGAYFNHDQTIALLDIAKVAGYTSIQKEMERKHQKLHGMKYEWWNYRAKLLGFSADDLRTAMQKVNKKYKNQRQALMALDKYELSRVMTIDLFKVFR